MCLVYRMPMGNYVTRDLQENVANVNATAVVSIIMCNVLLLYCLVAVPYIRSVREDQLRRWTRRRRSSSRKNEEREGRCGRVMFVQLVAWS
jgi:hypothetical protein